MSAVSEYYLPTQVGEWTLLKMENTQPFAFIKPAI